MSGKQTNSRRFIHEKTLGEFYFNAASKFRDRIHQIDALTDEKESYGLVKQRSVRLAIQLKKRQLQSPDVVAICTKNSLDNVIPVFAAFLLGAKVSSLDPTLSERQTKHLISLVEPKFIFVEKDSLNLIENIKRKPEIIVFGTNDFDELLKPDENETNFRPEEVDEDETAVILFSSGTTGLPKAICHSHKSFLNGIDNRYGFIERYVEVMLHFTTLYCITGLMIVTSAFVNGTTRIFLRDRNPEMFFKTIEKYRASSVSLSPMYTKTLTNFKEAKKYDVSSLKVLLIGGTAMSKEQCIRVDNFFENAALHFVYAMTECGYISVFRPELYKKIGSCGKVLPEVKLKIVDPNTEEKLGATMRGEIRIFSNSVMTGYLKQSCKDTFDSEGFLKTGDIGYVDEDGFLFIEDRLKEMFKYRSLPIFPSAIEAVLQEHPAVAEAIVLGVPCNAEIGDIPTACVVLHDNARVSENDIQKFVEERVSDCEKLRGGVIFVKELQKTPAGKYARRHIKDSVVNKQKVKTSYLYN